MVAEDNFGILWDSLNFWGNKCFRNIHKCSFESLLPKVSKDISFLFGMYRPLIERDRKRGVHVLLIDFTWAAALEEMEKKSIRNQSAKDETGLELEAVKCKLYSKLRYFSHFWGWEGRRRVRRFDSAALGPLIFTCGSEAVPQV